MTTCCINFRVSYYRKLRTIVCYLFQPDCPCVLSVKASDRIHHFPVMLTAGHHYNIGKYDFESLDKVIDYYRKNALTVTADDVEVKLGHRLAVHGP